MKHLVIIAAAGLAVSACATADADREAQIRDAIDQQQANAETDGMICENRQVLGSLRRQRVCYNPDDVQRNSDNGRQNVERMQRMAPGPASG